MKKQLSITVDDLKSPKLSREPGSIVIGKGDIMDYLCLNKLKEKRLSFTNIPECIRAFNCLKKNHYNNV